MVIVIWKKVMLLFLVNQIFLIQHFLNIKSLVLGNYNEQLRVIDFPVYVSGKDDPKLTPLVPAN